jgi:hypothetical protein
MIKDRKFLCLLFYILLNIIEISFVHAQIKTFDTLFLNRLTKTEIHIIKDDLTGGIWAIGGVLNDQVFHINKRNHVKDLVKKAKLPQGINYTSLLCFRKNVVLLGTKNNYLYCLRNKRFVHITAEYGLADSIINAIYWDKQNKMVIIVTPAAQYVLIAGSAKDEFSIKRISGAKLENRESNIIKNYFGRPIIKAICLTAGRVDFSGRKKKYISYKDLRDIKKQLQPGDILFKRNDAQLVNIGIPGFWTHTAIYLGSKREFNTYFASVKTVGNLKPTEYLHRFYPQINRRMSFKRALVIESIATGVSINPLEHIAKSDYFAVLRPQLSKDDLFNSLLKAFDFYKIPYDFLFDFETDDAVVCSELVYKAFKTDSTKVGISFQTGTLNGKTFLSPNDIVHQFCIEDNSVNRNFAFVLFYKGDGKSKKAFLYNKADFCNNCKE